VADPDVFGGDGTPRVLTFDAPSLTVVAQVVRCGGRVRLRGQLTVPQRVCLEIRHGDGVRTVLTDDLGRFAAHDLPPGLVGFVAYTTDGLREATHWMAV
jgi:hypothetical protein